MFFNNSHVLQSKPNYNVLKKNKKGTPQEFPAGPVREDAIFTNIVRNNNLTLEFHEPSFIGFAIDLGKTNRISFSLPLYVCVVLWS